MHMRENTVLMYQLITVCHFTILACFLTGPWGLYIACVCVGVGVHL